MYHNIGESGVSLALAVCKAYANSAFVSLPAYSRAHRVL